MKTKSIQLKKLFCLLAFTIIHIGGFAQTKEKQNKINNKPAVQFQSEEYKTKWILNNPEKYRSMGGALTSDQQTQVNARQINNQNTVLKKEITIFPDIPSFPKYEQTGNPLVDNENYRSKKDAWINSHQIEYNNMNMTTESNGKNRVPKTINE